MKTVKYAAIAALLSCSLLTPVTPAFSAPAPTATDMQSVCNAYILDSNYTATVNNVGQSTGAPQDMPGTEQDFNFRADLNGPFHYSGFTQTNGPLVRIGGSPNMWTAAAFTQKVYENTLVDVRVALGTITTYTWNCYVTHRVTSYEDANHPGNNNGDNLQDGGNNNQNNGCGNGDGGPAPTSPPPGCGPKEVITTYYYNYPQQVIGDLIATDPATYRTTQTNVSRVGHLGGLPESDFIVSGFFEPTGTYALACISPTGAVKGNPGSWRAKNNYTGGQCSTATFNAAPTVAGREFDPIASNSLPSS
jgi:hypothetical protein